MKLTALILVLSCVMSWGVRAKAATEQGPLVAQKLAITIAPPPWPADVSEPYADYQWPDALCLKPDLQKAILEQLLWAKSFPRLADKIATAQAKRDTDVANAFITTERIAHTAEVAQVRASLPSWPRVILFVGGALAVGFAAGYVGGKVLP